MPLHRRCLDRALATLVAVALGFGSQAAFAQQLPEALVKNTGALSAAQRKTIRSYVDPLVNQLTRGNTDSQVTAARSKLVAPFTRKKASAAFLRAYSRVLADSLVKGLKSPRLLVRLNASIVLAHVRTGQVIDIAAQALKDRSTAVRYWGAKALRRYVESQSAELARSQRQRIKRLLAEAAGSESSSVVLQQTFLAMAAAGRAGEHQQLYAALRARLKYHLEHPGATLQAERSAIQAVFVDLVQLAADGKDVKAPVKELVGPVVQYYALAAKQLLHDGGKLQGYAVSDRVEMVEFCDPILRFALKKLGNSRSAPPPLGPAINPKDWKRVRRVVRRWQQLLEQSPFGLSKQQVTLPTG